MKKQIKLVVNEQELVFNLHTTAYNKYVNALTPTNKVQPSHNFCMSVVDDKSKDALSELLKQPGAAPMIAGHLVEEYQPEFEISVKK